jgi:hypothetical protein
MWPYLTIDNNCGCEDCQPCTPSTSVCYAGPNLTCTGIQNKDTLSVALQKIETKLCTSDPSIVYIAGVQTITGLKSFKGTVESDTAPLGEELTTTATGTNWTGTNFATGYTHIAGSVGPLISTLAAVIDTYYQITYTITGRTAGSITINYGGTVKSGVTATGATGPRATDVTSLSIVPTTDFNGTVVLSIKTIGTSIATTTFLNSSGEVNNEIRISNIIGNYFNGVTSGSRNTTGRDNFAIGYRSLVNTTTGYYNVALGEYTLYYNTIGYSNLAVGYTSLYYNTGGYSNVAIGHQSMFYNTTGWQNTAVGNQSLSANTTGIQNTGVGAAALGNNVLGQSNVALGQSSGRWLANKSTIATSLYNSVMIGFRTSPLADTQSNQIVIGYDSTGLGSNTTVLGNSSITHTAIYGNLLLGGTVNNGVDKLQVNGSILGTSFKKSGGLVSQFLKADGSVDSTIYNKTAARTTTYNESGGSTSLTLAASVYIDPNFFTDGDYLKLKTRFGKINANSTGTIGVYTNSINSLSGATQIGKYDLDSNFIEGTFTREFLIRAGLIRGFYMSTVSSLTGEDVVTTTFIPSTASFSTTSGTWILVAMQMNSMSDGWKNYGINISN